MIRDYYSITPEQEVAETIVFGQWFDWFFEMQGIPQDTWFELPIGTRSIKQYKEMLMERFPLQESALTYLPGVAKSGGREKVLEFVHGVMEDFSELGYLK